MRRRQCALRDGAAGVLRVSPAGRDRADGQSVPAGRGRVSGRTLITIRWSRSARRGRGCSGRGWPGGSRGSIPDERFDELFARLGSHRDRALVALWISTGARASELLATSAGVAIRAAAGHGDPHGIAARCSSFRPRRTRSCGCGCTRSRCAAWCRRAVTSRCGGRCGARSGSAPDHAARAMFVRANVALGANWSLRRPAARRRPDAAVAGAGRRAASVSSRRTARYGLKRLAGTRRWCGSEPRWSR